MPKVKVKMSNPNGLRTNDYLKRLKTNNITITQFYQLHETFINDKKLEGLAKRTIDDHIKHIEYFKKFIKKMKRKDIERDTLTRDIFKNYMNYMMFEQEYKPCTINLRVSSLKCYLNWLYKNNYVAENYALMLKKVKNAEDTIKPLTQGEIKSMLNATYRNSYAGLRDFTIMILILDCGIRIQELCNTRIDDVDIKNKLLIVRTEVSKTRRHRELPLSKQSLHLLKQLIDIAQENNSGYIFMSSQTSKKVDHNVIIKNFERYGNKAGIKKRCTPHVFRHTFAVTAVRKGMDVFCLQRILGHNNISTTRQYVQLDTKDLVQKHREVSVLEDFLKGGRR